MYQTKDYNEKIKKCDEKIYTDIFLNGSENYFTVTFETISADKALEFQTRYNNERSNYILGTGGNPVAGDAFDTSMVYLVGSQVSYAAGQVIKGFGKIAESVGKALNSVDDIVKNPQSLYGKSKADVSKILGDGWTEGAYGSSKTGWKFTKGDQSIFYHPGGGRHGGSYYGYSSGATGKIKIVGPDYVPLPGDKATIINVK